MTSVEARRAQLLKRLAELEERLQEIDEELDTHQSKDWEEMATEREDEEVLEGLGLQGQEEIVRNQGRAAAHRRGRIRLLREMRR